MKPFQRALDSQMCIGKLFLNLYLGYCLCISHSINNRCRFYYSVVVLFGRRLLNEQRALSSVAHGLLQKHGQGPGTQPRGRVNGLCRLWQKLLAAHTGNQLQWAAEKLHSLFTNRILIH